MPHSKAYNAGKHVHNFFAEIGTFVAKVGVTIGHGAKVGVTTVGHTVGDFARGVKDGGPVDAKPKAASPKPATRKPAAA